MSDSTVNAHLEGIISDFDALKRSFEVEEMDGLTNPSPLSRRTANPLRSSATSRFHELGSRNSENSSRYSLESFSSVQHSPKSSARHIELSRRTEISIDISSKQLDNLPSPRTARFGLRKPQVSLHNRTQEPGTPRKTEITLAHTQEPLVTLQKDDVPALILKTNESVQRKVEPPSPGDSFLVLTKEPEAGVAKQEETPSKESENSFISTTNATSSFSEFKIPTASMDKTCRVSERSEVTSSNNYNSSYSGMVEPVITEMPLTIFPEKQSVDLSYVGIDAILEQMRRKAMKQGFELNIMVVGQSGLGKSTLMNTLFKSKVSRKSVIGTAEERIPKTIEIKSISHDIEEKGVRMKLTVIDTPGFGDQINNENCWQPIMKFVNEQYEQYLQEEININRKKRIPDSRVHCCIYFIPPTGHCLRHLDVEFMRHLGKVVNIVPVIAKADTLTLEERDFFKKKIREDLRVNNIDVYPQKEFDEDTEDRLINEKIREIIPFAVVGSDQEYQVNGRRLLGRKTKWGTIEVENIAHCEFAYLQDLLIRTHMQNFKDITSSIHYEKYRVQRLNENNVQASGLTKHHPASHEI
ncbi:septin 9a isoform X2 [Trichomycterus rosablanca]|uniref:septin 9a isoform X2 n=1 Tax=Trichomycterus rosablanca TaxID=2290929 RepID=UPI002F35DA38